MENDSEAIYIIKHNDENLAIDDRNESVFSSPSANDRENLILEDLNKIKLTRKERGKKLAEINKQRKELGIEKKKPKSLSKKSGVLFSVSRVIKNFKMMHPHKIISQQAGIYLASVLEYMCSEILDLSGNMAISLKKKRIIPRYIQISIHEDEELHSLLKDVIIAEGGVVPFIHPEVEKTKSTKRKSSIDTTESESATPKNKKSRSKLKYSQKESHDNTLDEISQNQSIQQSISSESISQTEVPLERSEVVENSEYLPEESEQFQPADYGQVSEELEKIPSSQVKEIDQISQNYIVNEIENTSENQLNQADKTPECGIESNSNEYNVTNNHHVSFTDSSHQESDTPNQSTPLKSSLTRLNLEYEDQNNSESSNIVKNNFINFESYLNIQASSESLVDSLLLSNKRMPLASISPITFQGIFRPIENNLLITDRKIIPNVRFNRINKSTKKSFENS